MTTPTDWRALCAELLDALCNYETAAIDATLADRARIALAEAYEVEANNPPEGHPDPEPFQAILRERAAALAQPEPVGPTKAQLLELMPETMRDEFGYAAKVCSDATGGQVKPDIFRVCLNHTALEYARAVLARWGRPAPQPIPIVERLPGDQLCWWFEADEDGGYGSNWTLLRIRGSATGYTHWLPHHALPVPVSEQDA